MSISALCYGLCLILGLIICSYGQPCNPACLPTQFCGNTSTFQPVCVACSPACYNCTGSGPEKCITCGTNYYMFSGICRECDLSCNGCNGAGRENCKKCAIAYYDVGGICRPCPPDTFGENCQFTCHCLGLNEDDCDRETGLCASFQCEWGWKNPPQCQTACEPNRFGVNCVNKCNCPVNDTCSPSNGRCDSGQCHPEYGGPACQIHLPKLVEPPKVTNNKCGHITVTFNGWVKDSDIGEGPIARYIVYQQQSNSSDGWVSKRNISHIPTVPFYTFNLTNLDTTAEYRYRVDVRAQDGEKLLQEFSSGFPSEYYKTDCIVPTTTASSLISTTTAFKPPVGSLFTSFTLTVVNGDVQADWSIDPNYVNVVGSLTISYGIIEYGDCQTISNPIFTNVSLGTGTTYTLPGLETWTRYKIRLVITTSQQNISDIHKQVEREILTPEAVPIGTVQNVIEIANTSSSLTVSWNAPDCQQRKGELVRYDVLIPSLSRNISSNMATFQEIKGLETFTEYSIQIAYVNSKGAGPLSQAITFRTGEGVPGPPALLSVTPDVRSIIVKFFPPTQANGRIITYDIAYSLTGDFTDILQKPSTSNSTVLTGLTPATNYFVKVRARTGAGYGIYSNVLTTTTTEDFPGPPASLNSNFRNETCLGITWQQPQVTNGIITGYLVISHDTSVTNSERNLVTPGTTTSTVLCNLSPGHRYQIEVSASTSKGYGDSIYLFNYTEQATPSDPPPPKRINATATSITITIDPVVLSTGPLSAYLVYVNDISPTGRRKRTTGIPPGVLTGKLLPTEILTTTYFTVGDGKTYNGIQNPRLTSGRNYDIYLAIESTLLGVTKTSYSKMIEPVTPTVAPPAPVQVTNDYTGVIVAIVVIILLILIIIIVLCVIYWYRRKNSYSPSYIPQYDDKGSHEVYSHVDDYDPHKYWNTIYSHRESRYIIAGRELLPSDGTNFDMNGVVEAKHAQVITFQQEFHDLPHGQLASWNMALKGRNQRRNRFPHLLPYDHSRIVLRPDDNSADDFINANFIHGYHKQNAYIAAQSPFNDETVLDFWRMIYQTNVSVIVMITNIIEDNIVKCTQYWPDEGQGKVTYGQFYLELIDTLEFASYVIRTLKFKPNNGSTRVIHIFDFCSWPDHGVLDDPIPLLEMRFKVREYHSDSPTSPLLVHCGTGVGRTGTYIALDSLLEQYDREGRISVSAFVRRMRKDRIQMVRTVKQYIFIYDAIFEAKHAGNTRAGLDLKEKYHLLTRKNPRTKHSYLRDQFDALCRYTRKLHSAKCSDALSHLNVDKNRFPDVVPSNTYRAVLTTPGGKERTDYVNAVLVNSHKKRDHFIITQTPLHTTVIDFWKLVYDHNVHTIVMMENYKHEDDTCAEYWPEEKKMKQFEPFFIDSIAVYQQDNITIRHFKIHSMLNPKVQAREVRQFQFNAWNDTEFIPKSKSMILDLIDLVKDWQNVSCEDECPIIVHCKDGATHSGLYVAVSNICDAMLYDEDVDVFHTVKHIKKRRTQIVDLVEQYRFCYKVLWDYMNMRLPGGTLTNMMDHTQGDKLYNVGSLSLPSYTSHLEYSQFDYAA